MRHSTQQLRSAQWATAVGTVAALLAQRQLDPKVPIQLQPCASRLRLEARAVLAGLSPRETHTAATAACQPRGKRWCLTAAADAAAAAAACCLSATQT